MSTLVQTSFGVSDATPPLRLLERPARPPRFPRATQAPRVAAQRPVAVTAPRERRRHTALHALARRIVQQIERYWAWGETLGHHRMGSYQRR